jgi:hypothetical protein
LRGIPGITCPNFPKGPACKVFAYVPDFRLVSYEYPGGHVVKFLSQTTTWSSSSSLAPHVALSSIADFTLSRAINFVISLVAISYDF